MSSTEGKNIIGIDKTKEISIQSISVFQLPLSLNLRTVYARKRRSIRALRAL